MKIRIKFRYGYPVACCGVVHFTVTASIGISLYPQDESDAESLLKKDDAAMYRVKGTGKNAYQFFSLGEVGRERELIG